MTDNNKEENLIPDLAEEVEKLLRTDALSEEQKVSALLKVLEILDGHKKEVL